MNYLIIIIPIVFGIFLGIITGLTPGIHINLIASIIVAYSFYILKIFDPLIIVLTITAMAVTHTVFDIMPTTILGIPNSDNLTMLLPAHKLTMDGKAKLAILYGLLGNASGLIITITFMPLLIKIIPAIYPYVKEHIATILISITGYIIIKNKNKYIALIFFIASGIIGILAFNIKTIDQPLLPLLSGIFGLSALILSINNKIEIPEQNKEIKLDIQKKEIIKHSLTTAVSSFLTNFLPGLTSSHTALISNKISKVKKQEEYIILSNAASSSATIISFIAFYTINKTRSGAVAAIQFLINTINLPTLIIIISITLLTMSISTLFAIKITDILIKNIKKINYKKISMGIIILIVLIVLIITRLEGLLVLFTSTSLGILAERMNIERINLTGCLILPVIIYLI